MIKEIHKTTEGIMGILYKGRLFPYVMLYIPVFSALFVSVVINKIKRKW